MLAALAAALLCCDCDRHVRVTKEMTWECVPGERDARYPDAEPVRFRYVEDPSYFDLASGRGLCRQLMALGDKTAHVTYDVWGGPLQRLHGYAIVAIDGTPLQDIGGPARSGNSGGNSAPHPLTRALE